MMIVLTLGWPRRKPLQSEFSRWSRALVFAIALSIAGLDSSIANDVNSPPSTPDGAHSARPASLADEVSTMQNQPQAWQRFGRPGLPPTPFSGYTTFVDPTEHSFAVEVPTGWKTEGGLVRASAVDTRPWVRVTSPDGLISAFIGDGQITPGTLPTATLARTGFYVGRRYGTATILPYIPARQFAEKYAVEKLKGQVSDLKVVAEVAHPDLAPLFNGTVGATKSECASIKLTCSVHDLPAVGYYLAATKETVQMNSGMWWVTYIAGEICSADRQEAGLSVLTHMIQTMHLDPAWQKISLENTAAVSANYRATANAVSNSIINNYWSQQAFNEHLNQGYWNRQAVNEHASNNWSDMMAGQQTVVDPTTGTKYKVQDNASHHWINQGGAITGTSGTSPGIDWRPLNPTP